MRKLLGMLIVLAVLAPACVIAQDVAAESAPESEEADAKAGAAAGEGPPASSEEPVAAEQPAPAGPAAGVLDSHKQKVSYCLGLNIGRSFRQGGIDVDMEILVKGISDAQAGSKPLLTDEQIRETMTKFQEEMMVRRQAEMIRLAQKNEADGKAFLEENRQKPGVVTLPSGLQYEVINEGEGESPGPDDTVIANYRGRLIDGTEFERSSPERPATFQVKDVIAGWTEALQLMKVGATWRLFVPSDLAYGEPGRPPRIGPNATLIFEVELVGIEKAPEQAEPATGETGAETAQ